MEKKATSKRYPAELKERAVRMVKEFRQQDPGDRAVISRVARQLGVGDESLRAWVKQSEVDSGARAGLTTAEQAELKELRNEVRALRLSNDILQAAATFFGAELDPPTEEVVAFIDTHRDNETGGRRWGVEPICAELAIAPSTYYDAKSRPPSARAPEPRRQRVLRHRRKRRRRRRALGAALAAAVIVAALVALRSSPMPAAVPVLGVLAANPSLLARDGAAGVRLATLNLSWELWEPGPAGEVSARYRSEMVATAEDYRKAGWSVAVDVGLQQPPRWVLDLPGGQLVDQNGAKSQTADFEFSSSVRAAAASYIHEVVKSLGGVEYYRIGLSAYGEADYQNIPANAWWAFGPAQQAAGDLPSGVGASPLPGWVPGDSIWKGKAVTRREATAWSSWYFGASVNAHAWEMATFRAAGFSGKLELVMPGIGTLPAAYKQRLSEDLAPNPALDPYSTMNIGAVWWKFLDELPSLANTVVDISSVYDQSGTPRGNVCEPSDTSVAYTDPHISQWSDTRWLTYLADKHQLSVVGENPGDTPASDLPGIILLVHTCGLIALQWAWDDTLDRADGSATIYQVHSAFAGLRP